MGAAKMQKATLDPNKISGRCGRLKCCLRYEETTYEDLKRKLPRINSRVKTSEGIGYVEETMILTQLVKVRLETSDRILAVANEELLERDLPQPPREQRRDAQRPVQPEPQRPPAQSRAPQPKPPVDDQEPTELELDEMEREVEEAELPASDPMPPAPSAIQAPRSPAPPSPQGLRQPPPPPRQPQQPPPDTSQQNRPPGMGSLGRSRRRGRGRGQNPH
jgi:hypothetical protein